VTDELLFLVVAVWAIPPPTDDLLFTALLWAIPPPTDDLLFLLADATEDLVEQLVEQLVEVDAREEVVEVSFPPACKPPACC